MKKRGIALVGAGKGGTALLGAFLRFPELRVSYVVDLDPDAPGMILARKHNIQTQGSEFFEQLHLLSELELIFEATGDPIVFDRILREKPENVELVGKSAAAIVFSLLDLQNETAVSLREHQANLERHILERTEALARANQELESRVSETQFLNRKLQRINEERSKYLARSTHQLKAPFAAIQCYVEMMLSGYVGDFDPSARAILVKILERCEALTTSIREMLELAKLRSFSMAEFPFETVSLGKVLHLALECSSVLAERRGIALVCPSEPLDIPVFCNKGQAASLFSILLDNAINYSNQGSSVEMEVDTSDSDAVRVSVCDHGIGIPPENQEKIFDEYFRSNNAAEKHHNGSGLGLSIAKEIASLNHFTISVESRLGEGSTFRVTCPVVRELG